jgi:hypothetical protein
MYKIKSWKVGEFVWIDWKSSEKRKYQISLSSVALFQGKISSKSCTEVPDN